jgi:hypothetical protein
VLRLNFSPSAYLTAILVIAHLMTGAILWLVDVPTFASLAGTVFVVVSLSYYLYHVALLRAPSSIVEARLKAHGAVEMQRRDGSVLIGRLLEVAWFIPILRLFCFSRRGDDLLAPSWCCRIVCRRRSFASCASG